MNKQYVARGAAVLAMLLAAAATGYGLYAMFAGCGTGCSGPSAQASMSASTQLPLLTITGVLALLVALALVSVAFSLMDLSDKSEALGLPAGSIRAVLALALVLIFAILTIFLYSDMAAPPTKDLSAISGLTSAQAKALSSTVKVVYEKAEQKSTDPKADPKADPTFTVYFREPRNPAAEDFAKQVLVLIGTLVTSVTSFYFGSKAASTPGSTAPAPAQLPAATPPAPNTDTVIPPGIRIIAQAEPPEQPRPTAGSFDL